MRARTSCKDKGWTDAKRGTGLFARLRRDAHRCTSGSTSILPPTVLAYTAAPQHQQRAGFTAQPLPTSATGLALGERLFSDHRCCPARLRNGHEHGHSALLPVACLRFPMPTSPYVCGNTAYLTDDIKRHLTRLPSFTFRWTFWFFFGVGYLTLRSLRRRICIPPQHASPVGGNSSKLIAPALPPAP